MDLLPNIIHKLTKWPTGLCTNNTDTWSCLPFHWKNQSQTKRVSESWLLERMGCYSTEGEWKNSRYSVKDTLRNHRCGLVYTAWYKNCKFETLVWIFIFFPSSVQSIKSLGGQLYIFIVRIGLVGWWGWVWFSFYIGPFWSENNSTRKGLVCPLQVGGGVQVSQGLVHKWEKEHKCMITTD